GFSLPDCQPSASENAPATESSPDTLPVAAPVAPAPKIFTPEEIHAIQKPILPLASDNKAVNAALDHLEESLDALRNTIEQYKNRSAQPLRVQPSPPEAPAPAPSADPGSSP